MLDLGLFGGLYRVPHTAAAFRSESQHGDFSMVLTEALRKQMLFGHLRKSFGVMGVEKRLLMSRSSVVSVRGLVVHVLVVHTFPNFRYGFGI